MQLPLHAAGIYSDPEGPRAFNSVVSSYTPSLSALKSGAEGTASPSTAVPSVLVVTQPDTIGQPRLPILLRHFLRDQIYPDIAAEDLRDEDLPRISSKAYVYHSAVARFYAPVIFAARVVCVVNVSGQLPVGTGAQGVTLCSSTSQGTRRC